MTNIIIRNGYHAFMALKLSKIGKTDEDIEPEQQANMKANNVDLLFIFPLITCKKIYRADTTIPKVRIYRQKKRISVADIPENKFGSRKNKLICNAAIYKISLGILKYNGKIYSLGNITACFIKSSSLNKYKSRNNGVKEAVSFNKLTTLLYR